LLVRRKELPIQTQDESFKKFLETAARSYAASLPGSEAQKFLERRGIDGTSFALGYVKDPLAGHEQYRGCLALPYLRRSARGVTSVVSIRFRCLQDHKHGEDCYGKYRTVLGDTPRLYNTIAIQEESRRVGIAEGELDAVVASQTGLPTVGVPGSNNWKPFFKECFTGFQRVYVFGDGDEAGRKFVNTVLRGLPNAKPVVMPEGHDVNSFVLERGTEAFLSRLQ
jgi:hypothetical protein